MYNILDLCFGIIAVLMLSGLLVYLFSVNRREREKESFETTKRRGKIMYVQNEKANVLKAILASVAGFFIFHIAYILAILIFGIIISTLQIIPIVSGLFDLLIAIRRETPDVSAMLLATLIAYYLAKEIIKSVAKSRKTIGLSSIIAGLLLLIVYSLALFANIVYGNPILANILIIVSGFLLFNSGRYMVKRNDNE